MSLIPTVYIHSQSHSPSALHLNYPPQSLRTPWPSNSQRAPSPCGNSCNRDMGLSYVKLVHVEPIPAEPFPADPILAEPIAAEPIFGPTRRRFDVHLDDVAGPRP
ncbi:hypothetical protein BC938DRAFT_472211 [Jimgerdemannia flammicorona]|uniref:Uncharacterized protein n=1 Tax=Jimgerdemannia flammicorona TaxID=994334 RepID=A0A433QU23_9FUNG|nr:hypothetical protein BC938DRAFT_472211 [Jimgerdemannia flammicorona]